MSDQIQEQPIIGVTEAGRKKDLRYYSLDFWRGVACLLVVLIHSTPYITENPEHIHGNIISKRIFSLLSQGWIGVPMFFVISGYCIAAACESAMSKGMATKTYFFRRFRRIYPPFWIVLLLVVGMHLAFQLIHGVDDIADKIWPFTKPWAMSIWQWLGTLTLSEGWRDHLIGDKSRYFIAPAWSLGYEEQFYFVCGVAMLFGRKWFYRSLAVLSAAVFVVAFICYAVVPLPIDGFFFDGRWMMFAAGVLVFYVLQFGDERSRKRALVLLALGFCIALFWAFKQPIKIAEQVVSSFPFAMLLILLFKHDRKIANARILRPLTFCGIMCYSLYLVHYPVEKVTTQMFYRMGVQGEWSTLFVTIPISVLIAVAVSWGFYLLVERRFLNTPPKLSGASKPAREEKPIQETPILGNQPSTPRVASDNFGQQTR